MDADGKTLYIGCTANVDRRTQSHRLGAPWWKQVQTMTVERYPTKREARQAEAAAIYAEQPPYNIQSKTIEPEKLRAERVARGAKLREIRESLGLSGSALAARLGVSRATVSMWEIGQTTPRLPTQHAIAKTLGVPWVGLFGETVAA